MSRIKPQPREDAAASVQATYDKVFGAGRDPIADPGTATGTPGDWYTTWGRVPGILDTFGAYTGSTVPPALKALATMRTGYARQSQFVFSQHCKVARVGGVAEEKIEAVPYWQVSDVFSPLERAVLAYVDALALEGGRVHDKVFDALREGLSEEQILMLTHAISMYIFHATTGRALRMEYDDVPERIVEIPKPPKPKVQDWKNWAWAERAPRKPAKSK